MCNISIHITLQVFCPSTLCSTLVVLKALACCSFDSHCCANDQNHNSTCVFCLSIFHYNIAKETTLVSIHNPKYIMSLILYKILLIATMCTYLYTCINLLTLLTTHAIYYPKIVRQINFPAICCYLFTSSV